MRPIIFALTLILLPAAEAAETQAERHERNEYHNELVAAALKRVLAQHPPLPRPDPRREQRR